MTTLSEAELTQFATASAIRLKLPLDDETRVAVVKALRGLMVQAALVLESAPPEDPP
jgi:hypothetical protein